MADDAVIPVDLADQPELVIELTTIITTLNMSRLLTFMLPNVPPIIAITECVAHKGSNGYLKLIRRAMVIGT